MQALAAVAVAAAGVAAGGINAIVGSGTLITFPTLLACGLPPVLANVSNNVGLVPGVFSGAWGYRRELRGQRSRLMRFGAASLAGGLAGSLLLLELPPGVFGAVVPVLILAAVVLVLLQPRLSRRLARRPAGERSDGGPLLWLAVLGTGVYGGYFGAAQGVVLMGLFGSFIRDDLQRLNAAKNVLSTIVNAVAAAVFIAFSHVDWVAAALIAGGSTVGGLLGARIGRRLAPNVLRAVIVTVGTVAAALMLARLG